MNRGQLEHIIRAAAAVADDDTIVVVGSQAILGQYPDAPRPFLVSDEADVYPLHYPERSDLVDGSIGEGSPFHELFGYYAQGVGPTTAILPDGWSDRLIPVCNANTRGATGLCLEIHDLVVAKTIAARAKDIRFLVDAAMYNLVQLDLLQERLNQTPTDSARKEAARQQFLAAFPRR